MIALAVIDGLIVGAKGRETRFAELRGRPR